jgi:cell division protein FtsB
MLKSAFEIALEKHEKYEELSAVTDELMEHVHLLEEGWNAIQPRPAAPEPQPLRRAA